MGAPTGTKESSYEASRGALRLLLMEYPNEVAHMEHGSSLGIPRGTSMLLVLLGSSDFLEFSALFIGLWPPVHMHDRSFVNFARVLS